MRWMPRLAKEKDFTEDTEGPCKTPQDIQLQKPESTTRISWTSPWLASGIPNPSTVHNRCRLNDQPLSKLEPRRVLPSGNHELQREEPASPEDLPYNHQTLRRKPGKTSGTFGDS
ncbi:hypothetical protein quinque_009769 [Culex quinquefasciatus]